jgi:hypothetical protein
VSLKVCLPGMVERGEISQEQADYMADVYDQIEAKYRGRGSDASAAANATRDTVAQLEAETFQRKRQAILQMAAQRTALDNIQTKFKGDIGHAAMAIFDKSDKAAYSGVEQRRKAIQGRAHAMMEGILSNFRRRVTGQIRKPALLKDVVREAFGEDTGSLAAKELAKAWAETAEMLRQRFNQAGGAVGKLENWGFPQSHNAIAVRKVGFEAWRDFITPRLDPVKMVDGAGQPLTPQTLQATLRHVYDTIHTDGWFDRIPGTGGAKKLANRRADSRFLIFKDADSWMQYQEAFGSATPFDAMMGHISGMSRDIALMEILGPNPNATVRWLKDTVTKDAQLGDGSKLTAAAHANERIQAMYDTITGTASTPINPRVATWGQGIRSFLTSALLGGATVSATSDVGFQGVTRRFNGLPVVGALTGYFKLLRPYMSADQKLAVRLGLIAEEASKMASAQNRYLGESMGPELASRLSDGVLRISGLSPWTQAGRWAFGMETLGFIADNADKPFSQLNSRFRGMMERYGIGSSEWAKIRQTPLYEERGATFLRPADVKDTALGDKLLEMISHEVDFAVPSATLTSRSLMNLGKPGTIAGEASRTLLMYKNFSISMLLTHGARGMAQSPFNALKYAAGLAITTTALGAMAVQLKEIAKGRDPLPMADPKFWGRALLQGGGVGIFGDFIGASENRYGGGLAETIAGPAVGLASDVLAVPWELTKEEDKRHLGRMASKLVSRYTPGSSLWYARLAFQRTMMDQMQAMVDPEYYDSWDRMEKYAERTGQGYWWEPGQMSPQRAPDTTHLTEAMPE